MRSERLQSARVLPPRDWWRRLTNAIEAVSHKLTSVEYLELYNLALALP